MSSGRGFRGAGQESTITRALTFYRYNGGIPTYNPGIISASHRVFVEHFAPGPSGGDLNVRFLHFRFPERQRPEGLITPPRPRRAEKGISCLGSPTVDVLHPLYQVFHEAFGVVIPSGVACPEVEIAVAGVAAVSEVAEPVVVFVAVSSVADVAEPRVSVDIPLASDVLVPVSVVTV